MASFFSSLASGVKAVAKSAADMTVETYNDLTAFPSSVTCANDECGKPISVPASVWEWTCPKAHTNPGLNKTCTGEEGCKAERPKIQSPTVQCAECQTEVKVPLSNASKHAYTAATSVKKAAVATADYTSKTYRDLQSRPTSVVCGNVDCGQAVEVTAEAWAWDCAAGHHNGGDVTTCMEEDCVLKPANKAVEVTCAACSAATPVPISKARLHLQTAAVSTKRAAVTAKDKTVETYEHLKAAPQVFNCTICNAQLGVPPPQPTWVCGVGECFEENTSELARCAKCSHKRKAQVLCGSCGGVTDVPSSNLTNSVRATGHTVKKGATTLKDKVSEVASKKPEADKQEAGQEMEGK